MSYMNVEALFTTSNDLLKEVYKFLEDRDRYVFDDSMLAIDFKREIMDGITDINRKYPKHRAVFAHWVEIPGTEDYWLKGIDFCHYYLLYSGHSI